MKRFDFGNPYKRRLFFPKGAASLFRALSLSTINSKASTP
jgi:hypothetical protein